MRSALNPIRLRDKLLQPTPRRAARPSCNVRRVLEVLLLLPFLHGEALDVYEVVSYGRDDVVPLLGAIEIVRVIANPFLDVDV